MLHVKVDVWRGSSTRDVIPPTPWQPATMRSHHTTITVDVCNGNEEENKHLLNMSLIEVVIHKNLGTDKTSKDVQRCPKIRQQQY